MIGVDRPRAAPSCRRIFRIDLCPAPSQTCYEGLLGRRESRFLGSVLVEYLDLGVIQIVAIESWSLHEVLEIPMIDKPEPKSRLGFLEILCCWNFVAEILWCWNFVASNEIYCLVEGCLGKMSSSPNFW